MYVCVGVVPPKAPGMPTITRPVHALLCMAENAVNEIATRPDDIHVCAALPIC